MPLLKCDLASENLTHYVYRPYLIAELEKAIATVLRTERQYLHQA